jgi:hypothetical protein
MRSWLWLMLSWRRETWRLVGRVDASEVIELTIVPVLSKDSNPYECLLSVLIYQPSRWSRLASGSILNVDIDIDVHASRR